MNKAKVVFALLFIAIKSSWAAFELGSVDPRSTGMGGAGVAVSSDGWAIFRNPALCALGDSRLGTGWSQQFGLPELNQISIGSKAKIKGESFGVVTSRFGSALYNETSFGIVYAKEFHQNLLVGLEFGGRQVNIENYAKGTAVVATLGITVLPAKDWVFSVVWKNLNRPQISNYEDKIESSLIAGVAHELADNSILTLDIVQEKSFRAEFRAGAETQFLKNLWLRVGMRGEPIRPSAGFQIKVGRWGFNYGGDLHPDLGPSHTLGLDVRL